VTDARFDGHTAMLAHDFRHASRTPQVVHHCSPWLLRKEILQHPREQQVAANRRASLIKHDATIRIAIEAEACIKSAAREYRL
jgi:hypothetical protein